MKRKDSGMVVMPTKRGMAILLLLMTFVLLATPAAAQPVKVWVNAPEHVEEGATFVATIGVNSIDDFNAALFDLSFNSSVVKITDVSDGCLDGTIIPVEMWAFMDENTIRVLLEIPGVSVVSGSGYLAKISFEVVGKEGNESALNLSNGELVSIKFTDSHGTPEKIPAEWIDAEVGIASPPAHNIVRNINTGENFSSIQAAIDDPDTKDGHTIAVSGTYYEHVVVNKRLRLVGIGFPEISAGGDGSAIGVVHDGCVIEGFSVRWGDAGINVESDNNLIRDNIASSNLQGIYPVYASNNTLVNNTVKKNNKGISLRNSNNSIIMQNNASNNYGDGIYLDSSCNNTVLNNTAGVNNYGIHLKSSNNNIITNTNASGNYWNGISLDCSHNNTFMNNSVNTNDNYGFCLDFSSNNTLQNNAMAGNKYNFGVYGDAPSHFYQNIDMSNLVDEKPIYYWVGRQNQQIPDDAGFVGIVNCTNITVRDLTLTNNGQGVLLAYSKDSRIETVNVSNNYYGIFLYSLSNNTIVNNIVSSNIEDGIFLGDSSDNTITNNFCKNSSNGIYLYKSLNNTIANNNLSSNRCGIYLQDSSNSNISNNNVSNNEDGIYLRESSNSSISNNIISSNNKNGIYLSSSSYNNINRNNINSNSCGIGLYSSNNFFYLNNFVNNSENICLGWTTVINIWNSPQKISYTYNRSSYTNYMGNYWSDYSGSDADSDGIGDSPYIIDSDKDNYPLMERFENYFAPVENIFDTGAPENPYPSISGTHNGTITPSRAITVSMLYTYPCEGTGGHSEYVKIWNESGIIAETPWKGYKGDWHNISFDEPFTLEAGKTYNYTIQTGSYPQIHHTDELEVDGGIIRYIKFTDTNGKIYNNWIPAVRLDPET